MLEDILRNVNTKGYISISQLAKELDMKSDIIEEGITQLLRMGYLIEEKTGAGCADFCGNCPFAKSCSKEIVKTFKISESAERFLAKKQ